MAHVKRIKFGATAARTALVLQQGEPYLDTTLQAGAVATNLYVGDGATAGGVAASFGALTSVFGRTGVVVATAGDYTAAQITATPAGNLTGATAQAQALALQAQIDALNTVSASNHIAGVVNPTGADGQDGFYFTNIASGDTFGPRAAGVWPASSGNIYNQLGLSAVAAAAPTAAGTVGVGVVAARSDHSHAFQSAANTAVSAIAGLVATDTQAALAELRASIVTLTTASHAHTATPLSVLESIGNPVLADVGKTVQVTAAGTLGLVAGAAAPVTSVLGLTGVVAVTDLTVTTTHVGATDLLIIQTAAGPRAITVDNLMNAN